MNMDPDLIRIIQILVVAGIFLFAIARSFLRIFVKPFVPGSAPGSPENRKSSMKNFLDELRRDLGQGEQPPSPGGGLLDAEKDESVPSPATPPLRPAVERSLERPVAQPQIPGRAPTLKQERPRPAARPPSPAEKAIAAQRMNEAPARRTVRVRPAALEMTSEEIETDELALAAMHSSSIGDEEPVGQILGIDLQTAFILKEVIGPPRAYGRIRPRR